MKNYEKESLWVDVVCDKNRLEGIACDVWLPKNGSRTVLLDLFLKTADFRIVNKSFSLHVSGRQRGNYFPLCEIFASYLVRENGDAKRIIRGEEILEYRVRYTVWDLTFIQHFPAEKDKSTVNTLEFSVYPSIDNLQLGPVFLPDIANGFFENRLHDVKTLEIKLPNGLTASLISPDTIQCKIAKMTATAADDVSGYIDDILAVISFTARRRFSCYKWKLLDGNGTETSHYVPKYPEPVDKSRKYRNSSMIYLNPSAIKDCCEQFLNNKYREHIKRAIYLSMPNIHLDVDTEYIKLFVIVDLLAKRCRTRLSRQNTKPKQKETLSNLAKSFFRRNRVRLGDLWKLFKHDNKVLGFKTLYDIRNKLTHGDRIDPNDYPGIIVANQHLRWTTERMIAASLKIDLAQTDISPANLAKHLKKQKWRNYAKTISN